MKSLVCLKQVPDTETQIKVNSEGTGIVTEGIKYIINPYDEFSVEEALRLNLNRHVEDGIKRVKDENPELRR